MGDLIDTIPELTASWTVCFDIKVTGTLAAWSNIVHFTDQDTNNVNFGDRIPGVWLRMGMTTQLHICSAISTNKNTCFTSQNLLLNCYYKVEITNRFEEDGQTWFQVRIDGNLVYSVRNTAPMYFDNVKVYASDPWHPAAPVMIKNLVYNNLPIGKKLYINRL